MFVRQRKIIEITKNHILYKSSRAEQFDFCIHHVEGCAHGCKFCYGLILEKNKGRIRDYKQWISPKIVANALELLDKEIPKYNTKFVHLCYSTDPFMWGYPEVSNLTLRIIRRLNKDNIRCRVLTKGILPKDLANTKNYSRENEYGITLISLNEKFKKQFEPYSAPYRERLNSLKYLHQRGLKTWVSMEPYPTPNVVKQDFFKILREISFVKKILFGKLYYSDIYKSGHKDNKEFYKRCVKKLVAFCKKNNIECYTAISKLFTHIHNS